MLPERVSGGAPAASRAAGDRAAASFWWRPEPLFPRQLALTWTVTAAAVPLGGICDGASFGERQQRRRGGRNRSGRNAAAAAAGSSNQGRRGGRLHGPGHARAPRSWPDHDSDRKGQARVVCLRLLNQPPQGLREVPPGRPGPGGPTPDF